MGLAINFPKSGLFPYQPARNGEGDVQLGSYRRWGSVELNPSGLRDCYFSTKLCLRQNQKLGMVEGPPFPLVAGCQKTGCAAGLWERQDFSDPDYREQKERKVNGENSFNSLM